MEESEGLAGFSLSTENLDDREITLLGRWPDNAWLHVTTHFRDGTADDLF